MGGRVFLVDLRPAHLWSAFLGFLVAWAFCLFSFDHRFKVNNDTCAFRSRVDRSVLCASLLSDSKKDTLESYSTSASLKVQKLKYS